MDRRNLPFLLLLLHLIILTAAPNSSAAAKFKCTTTPAKCHAMIDYVAPPHPTTFLAVQHLFEIRNLRTLLGANNLPLTISPNETVSAKQTLKIPFPCLCHGREGTGVSNKRPTYEVGKADKSLHSIAAKVFAGVVTADEIAAANGLHGGGKGKVHVGQKLWIPLPCSCDDVDGYRVVHYGHVAESGGSLEGIAATYGVDVDTLRDVNGLKDGDVKTGQVLDVPIRACNSSIRDDSVDSKFLVANGTYAFTAHNCVQCKCDSSYHNWTLQCYESGVKPSDWSTCPAMHCDGHTPVPLGNSTASVCGGATCSYAGFSSNITIFAKFPDTCHANGYGGRIGPKYLNLGLLWLAHLLLHQLWIRPW